MKNCFLFFQFFLNSRSTWEIFENFRSTSEIFAIFGSTSEREVIGTPGEYNLGFIVVLLSNQNQVGLLSVL